MKKRLNVRFIIWLTISVVVLGVATHFLHAFQVQRNAHTLLNLANAAEEKGDLNGATTYLTRYLGLRPMDTEALVKLGTLLADDQLANSMRAKYRALLILNKALTRDPGRHDVRRMAVKLAIEFGRFDEASRDIKDRLLPIFPQDTELELLLARCYERTARYSDARDILEAIVQRAPTEVEAYTRLAYLLRQRPAELRRAQNNEDVQKVKDRADKTINDLVEANPKSFRAYLGRARYLRAYPPEAAAGAEQLAKHRAKIAADISRAYELAPDEAETILASADLAREDKRWDAARDLLNRGCEAHRRDWRMYKALARLESAAEKPEAAIAALQRGLQELENQSDLLWDLAELQIRLGQKSEAAETVAKIGNSDIPPAFRDSLTARIDMANGDWVRAARRLEDAFPALLDLETQVGDGRTLQLATQAGLLLANCYEQLGDTDRALSTFSQLAARDASLIPAVHGVARSLSTLGQYQESIEQYRRLVILSNDSTIQAGAIMEIARMTLLRNLERPKAEQGKYWEEVDAAIAQAERIDPLPKEVVLLKAESLAERGQIERARAVLLEKYGDPKQRPALIWVGLATLDRSNGQHAVDLSILDDAERTIGDHIELRLTRARHWATVKTPDAKAKLTSLAENIDQFSAEDKRRLRRGLASAHLQAGDLPGAVRLLEEVVADRPNDVNGRLILFELAAQAGDMDGMVKWQKEMEKIEKDDGVLRRYARARIGIEQARRGDKSALAMASAEIAAVAARRPNWPRVYLCEALIDDLAGRPNNALPKYQRAIELGATDSFAILRAAELLYFNGRFDEANKLFQRAEERMALTSDIGRLAADAALQAQDAARAMKLGLSAISPDSKDYRQQMLLGRLHWKSGELDRAKAAFQRARDLAANQFETWITLVQFLMATDQAAAAQAEVKNADERLTGADGLLTRACCHEVVGNAQRATELFQEALQANPNDPKTLRGYSDFCLRTGRIDDAQVQLRKLMEVSRNSAPEAHAHARRTLAYLLAISGDPQKANEALQMLASGSKNGDSLSPENILDRRARAQLLSLQHGRPKRLEALKIFEDLIAQKLASPDDYLLAAQIHEMLGDWAKARQRFLALLDGRSGVTAVHLTVAARSLLRNKDLPNAQIALKQLEQSQPDSLPTREIRARVLRAQGKTSEAQALIQEYARAANADLMTAAALLTEFEAYAAAEELIRQLVAQRKQPQIEIVLIGFLIDRNRFAEALELCDRAWESKPDAAVAEAYVRILSAMGSDQSAIPRIERRLEAATAQFPDRLEFLVALATVRSLQGRNSDAIALYRRVIDKEPRHISALNNLAWLLALSGGPADDALAFADRAVDLSGYSPGIVDTRAVAALAVGRRDTIDRAIDDLESIVAEQQTAVTYFHLARAYSLAERRRDAVLAWQRALALGLTRNHVHALEIPEFERLSKELN